MNEEKIRAMFEVFGNIFLLKILTISRENSRVLLLFTKQKILIHLRSPNWFAIFCLKAKNQLSKRKKKWIKSRFAIHSFQFGKYKKFKHFN